MYARQASSGKLVYPAGSDVPAGQLFSYQDGKQWHHVLIMNLTLPQGADRQVDRLVIREEAVEVALNSCFSTPRSLDTTSWLVQSWGLSTITIPSINQNPYIITGNCAITASTASSMVIFIDAPAAPL